MNDNEGNNEFPSTGMIMNAILRKQKELPWIFGKVMEKEGITDDEPPTIAGDDIKKEIFRKMFGKEEFDEDITDDESSISANNEETLEINDEQEVVFEEEEAKKSTTKYGSSALTKKRILNIEEQEKNTTYSWNPTSFKEAFTYRSKSQSKKSEKDFLIWSGERMKIFNQSKQSNLPRTKVLPKFKITIKPKNVSEEIKEDKPNNEESLSMTGKIGISIPSLNGEQDNMELKDATKTSDEESQNIGRELINPISPYNGARSNDTLDDAIEVTEENSENFNLLNIEEELHTSIPPTGEVGLKISGNKTLKLIPTLQQRSKLPCRA